VVDIDIIYNRAYLIVDSIHGHFNINYIEIKQYAHINKTQILSLNALLIGGKIVRS
jgi:hypothetical protein